MPISQRNKVYSTLIIITIASHIWLWLHMIMSLYGTSSNLPTCFFRLITSIPCPSCGITTASIALLKGDLSASLYINPIGFIAIASLIILSLFLVKDGIKKQYNVYKAFQKLEHLLKMPTVYIPLIMLVTTNWLWTITKTLNQ